MTKILGLVNLEIPSSTENNATSYLSDLRWIQREAETKE